MVDSTFKVSKVQGMIIYLGMCLLGEKSLADEKENLGGFKLPLPIKESIKRHSKND